MSWQLTAFQGFCLFGGQSSARHRHGILHDNHDPILEQQERRKPAEGAAGEATK